MKIKSLKLNTYIKSNNIKKPTDFITANKFTVVSNLVAKKYGAIFAIFLGTILTKYQALKLSPRYANKDNFEFWYTELDTKNDLGISYYIRKKCIKVGIELGLWSCEAKYNAIFRGHINKLDHFLIDWDCIAEFFMNLEKANDINENADKELIDEAIEEEIEELKEDKSNEIEITNAQIEDFVETLANQNGIKNKESYKLSLLNKYFANDKKTITNLKLFLNNKKTKIDSSEDYKHLLSYCFYSNKEKYYIHNINKEKDFIIVGGYSMIDDVPNILLKVPLNLFSDFEKKCFLEKTD